MNSTQNWTLQDDYRAVDAAVDNHWESLRGARIFVTGGTGFVGRWLLETLRYASQTRKLDTRVVVLTRDPDQFMKKAPDLCAWPSLTLALGDVSDFAFPDGAFSHLIHAATDASAELNENNPRLMFDTVLGGTRRTLDFAVTKTISRVLYLSSGAVYGHQPFDVTNVTEKWHGGPDCTQAVNAYAEGKRAAEMLCTIYGKQFGVEIAIARIFALLGPYISLDIHFAAGNFIRDAIAGRKILVRGNGLPVRSYLYAADLAVMLWHLLIRGTAGKAYNTGSEQGISIADLAAKTAALIGRAGYEVLGQEDKGWNPGRYVPDNSTIGHELGLFRTVSLEDSILRTAIWNGWKPWHQ